MYENILINLANWKSWLILLSQYGGFYILTRLISKEEKHLIYVLLTVFNILGWIMPTYYKYVFDSINYIIMLAPLYFIGEKNRGRWK
jgi:hypothetical protein